MRAINAAKLERIMAKPFIGALEGTTERMTCISLNSETLGLSVFGTADGKVCSIMLIHHLRLVFNADTILGYCAEKEDFRDASSWK